MIRILEIGARPAGIFLVYRFATYERHLVAEHAGAAGILIVVLVVGLVWLFFRRPGSRVPSTRHTEPI